MKTLRIKLNPQCREENKKSILVSLKKGSSHVSIMKQLFLINNSPLLVNFNAPVPPFPRLYN